MKTRKKQPRMGRPVKGPKGSELDSFGPLRLTLNDTLKILWACGARRQDDSKPPLTQSERTERIAKARPFPSQDFWSDKEALLILKCLSAPLLLAATENDSPSLRRIPLAFARLFAEQPRVMIEALPKIQRSLDKRDRTPKQAVAFDYALRRDERFWSEKSNKLAPELSQSLNLPITQKVVEHARAMIRAHLKTFPQTRR